MNGLMKEHDQTYFDPSTNKSDLYNNLCFTQIEPKLKQVKLPLNRRLKAGGEEPLRKAKETLQDYLNVSFLSVCLDIN